MSSPRRISNVMTSTPSVRAVVWTSRILSTTAGLSTLAKIANRPRPGTTSRKSSRRLPARSRLWFDRPVTLPPGRARLAIRPVPTGSPAPAKTMGMTDVASMAATTTAVPDVTMTSTLRWTNSAAISAARSVRPSAQRYSIAMVRPSIQPSSRSRCTKAATHWPWVAGVAEPKYPMVGRVPGCCARAATGHAIVAPPRSRDEVAPFHLRGHSMTSSARASSLSGIWRPSAFAVLRLITNANLMDCITGRSLLAFENPPGIDAGLAVGIGNTGRVAHQAARIDGLAEAMHRGNPMSRRQRDDPFPMGEHERPGADEQRASPAFDERCKRGLDIGIAARVDDDELLPDRLRRALHLSALRLGVGGVGIDKHRNRCRGGHELAQQLKSLRSQYAGEKDYAGDVAARPAEAGDEAVPDRVAAGHEHDRHGRGCGLGRERRIVVADDHRHRTADQISDQRRQAVKVILRRAVFDRDVLTLDVAGFPQPMAKGGHEVRYVGKRRAAQKPDHRHRRLLRPRRQRPRRRTAERG